MGARGGIVNTVRVAEPALGVAAFTVDGTGTRVSELEAAPRVRGASVVKPLLAWVAATSAPFATDRGAWEALAQPAITTSDNRATATLWSRAGGDRLLSLLNDRTGLAWHADGNGEHPSLRVMVTAGELARAYAAFVSDRDEVVERLRQWMREVPATQTFGVRRVASEVLGVEESAVAVKCGWFGGERAHAVVLLDIQRRIVGAAITTSWPPEEATRAVMRDATGDDASLAAAHDRLAGHVIRSATRRALTAAADW